ncbi:hypothetical protein TNCV_1263031 [Trichonephila clavipes]|nr:hypothetical protein TNCV_1263031 [Trichonephila clavipes]
MNETIHCIPHSALKIHTDIRMDDGAISGSGMHIETPGSPFDLKIRKIFGYCDGTLRSLSTNPLRESLGHQLSTSPPTLSRRNLDTLIS